MLLWTIRWRKSLRLMKTKRATNDIRVRNMHSTRVRSRPSPVGNSGGTCVKVVHWNGGLKEKIRRMTPYS